MELNQNDLQELHRINNIVRKHYDLFLEDKDLKVFLDKHNEEQVYGPEYYTYNLTTDAKYYLRNNMLKNLILTKVSPFGYFFKRIKTYSNNKDLDTYDLVYDIPTLLDLVKDITNLYEKINYHYLSTEDNISIFNFISVEYILETYGLNNYFTRVEVKDIDIYIKDIKIRVFKLYKFILSLFFHIYINSLVYIKEDKKTIELLRDFDKELKPIDFPFIQKEDERTYLLQQPIELDDLDLINPYYPLDNLEDIFKDNVILDTNLKDKSILYRTIPSVNQDEFGKNSEFDLKDTLLKDYKVKPIYTFEDLLKEIDSTFPLGLNYDHEVEFEKSRVFNRESLNNIKEKLSFTHIQDTKELKRELHYLFSSEENKYLISLFFEYDIKSILAFSIKIKKF